jgi:FdhD protein
MRPVDGARSVRDLPGRTAANIWRYEAGKMSVIRDEIATEYALTIFVNDRELATMVCTPDHMDELILGFLASEGVIRNYGQIESMDISTYRGVVRVKTKHDLNINQDFYNKRYIGSCCGKSRQSFYFFNDAQTAKFVEDETKISPAEIFQSMDAMDAEACLFHATGGVHIACLCQAGKQQAARLDIGRHNALDKLYGYMMMGDRTPSGLAVAFSGRISSEVLLKVAKMGIGIVLSRSAPTALALQMAEELNITTVGFVRNTSFNVYTHSWRVQQSCS